MLVFGSIYQGAMLGTSHLTHVLIEDEELGAMLVHLLSRSHLENHPAYEESVESSGARRPARGLT